MKKFIMLAACLAAGLAGAQEKGDALINSIGSLGSEDLPLLQGNATNRFEVFTRRSTMGQRDYEDNVRNQTDLNLRLNFSKALALVITARVNTNIKDQGQDGQNTYSVDEIFRDAYFEYRRTEEGKWYSVIKGAKIGKFQAAFGLGASARARGVRENNNTYNDIIRVERVSGLAVELTPAIIQDVLSSIEITGYDSNSNDQLIFDDLDSLAMALEWQWFKDLLADTLQGEWTLRTDAIYQGNDFNSALSEEQRYTIGVMYENDNRLAAVEVFHLVDHNLYRQADYAVDANYVEKNVIAGIDVGGNVMHIEEANTQTVATFSKAFSDSTAITFGVGYEWFESDGLGKDGALVEFALKTNFGVQTAPVDAYNPDNKDNTFVTVADVVQKQIEAPCKDDVTTTEKVNDVKAEKWGKWRKGNISSGLCGF